MTKKVEFSFNLLKCSDDTLWSLRAEVGRREWEWPASEGLAGWERRDRAGCWGADTFPWLGGDTVVVQASHWIPKEVL